MEQAPEMGPSPNTAAWVYFSQMAFWAVSARAFAIAAWHDGASGFFHTVTPLVYALVSIFFAFYFWLLATNWQGRAKRDWEKPWWWNRHPTEYVRPQSRFLQAAARFDTPFVVLSDLLVIGFMLVR
jgi:hypothetical protein